MSFNIEWDFDEEELMRAAMEKAQEVIREDIADMTCPVHGEHAQLTFAEAGPDPDRSRLKVTACCDEFAEAVALKIRERDQSSEDE